MSTFAGATLTTEQVEFYREALDLDIKKYRLHTPQLQHFVDVHPVRVNNPGDTVVLHKMKPLTSDAKTPLNESADVNPVKLPGADKVEITINEYGTAAVTTKRQRLFNVHGTGVSEAIVGLLGDHQQRTMDDLIRAVADAGTNQVFVNGGTATTTGAKASVAASDHFSSQLLRRARAKMIQDLVQPLAGSNFGALIHPTTSAILRSETGQAAWRDPMNAQDLGRITGANIGTYEGFVFFEDALSTVEVKAGAGAVGSEADVYRSYLLGKEALAQAVAEAPRATVSPQTDHLGRFFGVGWYAALGNAIYEQKNIVNVFTGAEAF